MISGSFVGGGKRLSQTGRKEKMICVEGKEGGKTRRERRESDRRGGGEETVEQVSRSRWVSVKEERRSSSSFRTEGRDNQDVRA